MCPGLALHVADVHGNSLERTFLATFPPAPSAPSYCVLLLSIPSSATPQLFPSACTCRTCFFSSPGDAALLWSLGRGSLGTEKQGAVPCPLCTGCGQGIQAVPALCRAPTEVGGFHGGSFEGLNTCVGEHRGRGFGLVSESPRRLSRFSPTHKNVL